MLKCRSMPILALVGLLIPSLGTATEFRHGLSMYGDLKYGPSFEHFDYINPGAPKGGRLRQDAAGTYDNLNPHIVKGNAASGLGLIFDTLMVSSEDEPFSEYGLVAESMEVPEDRSYVRFNMNPKARFHDGEPIGVDDVIYSFEVLRDEGLPLYRYYYANVNKIEQTGEDQVTFFFDERNNRELPLILGQLPVLPKHYYEDHEFDQTTLVPPIGSGPYRIGRFEAGKFIEYERVDDYWASEHPVNVGRNNFDVLRYDYFRDRDQAQRTFLAGELDIFRENSSKRWATGYDTPAVHSGDIILEELPSNGTSVMQGYVFNTRRELFQDPRVREAIGLAFDFDWMNTNLFYGQYERANSYFSGSEEFAARALPDEAELRILEPLRGRVPDEVFTTVYEPPTTDGSGGDRTNLRQALQLLREAGYEIQNGVMTHSQTGQRLEFEYLFTQPSSERIASVFKDRLKTIGVIMTLRRVDSAQFVRRLEDFDFDMVTSVWGQSLSPGNEQREFWGSEAADRPGSRNLIGIKDESINSIIETLIAAEDREELAAAARALDRVLLWHHFVVPQFYNQVDRIARWSYIKRPDETPLRGLDLLSWWSEKRYDSGQASN